MMKFLRVMSLQCSEWKSFLFPSFVIQCAQVAAFLFAHFVALLFPIFNKNVCLRKKTESFSNFCIRWTHTAIINIPDFSGSQRNNSTRHSQLFREKCAWEALILFGGNKQLIILPITQKRMLCGYQVILSLELTSWEFSETSQKDFFFLCSSDGMKHC